jgi:hypothetical protein
MRKSAFVRPLLPFQTWITKPSDPSPNWSIRISKSTDIVSDAALNVWGVNSRRRVNALSVNPLGSFPSCSISNELDGETLVSDETPLGVTSPENNAHPGGSAPVGSVS